MDTPGERQSSESFSARAPRPAIRPRRWRFCRQGDLQGRGRLRQEMHRVQAGAGRRPVRLHSRPAGKTGRALQWRRRKDRRRGSGNSGLRTPSGTVTHELEHVRFRKQFPKTAPRAEACEFDDVSRELSELGAIMSEFPVCIIQAQANKSWHDRRVELDSWFKYKLTQPSKHGERAITAGILKAIRCRCECPDVNAYLQRLVEFTTASWDRGGEKYVSHGTARSEMEA